MKKLPEHGHQLNKLLVEAINLFGENLSVVEGLDYMVRSAGPVTETFVKDGLYWYEMPNATVRIPRIGASPTEAAFFEALWDTLLKLTGQGSHYAWVGGVSISEHLRLIAEALVGMGSTNATVCLIATGYSEADAIEVAKSLK